MTVTDSGLAATTNLEFPVIALVRHGETEWNRERRIQGRTEVPLNGTGREQARAAGARLAEIAASTPQGRWLSVRSSPLGRAIETAEIIGDTLGLAAPGIDDGYWERDFGPAEGLDVAEIAERWPGMIIPGAESLEDLAERTAASLARVLETAPNTVVVAHGAMLRSGLGAITGSEIPRVMNGEIWLLRRTPAGYTAEVVEQHEAAALA